jgi:predicted Zn-dependent peptidase
MVKIIHQKNKIKTGILKNGLKYIINDNNIFSSCCIIFYIRVGAIHENDDEAGLSHLLEHMLFKGTQRYQTFMDLNKKFDMLNCSVNAATSKNLTFIDMKLPYQNIEEALKLVNEMVFKSLITKEELEKEKKVVLEEFNRTNDNPNTQLDILTTQFNFKKHRLSNLILGTKKNIKNFTRNQVFKFYKKYYIPSNCCISIVGNVTNNLKSKLEKIFDLKNNQKITHTIKPYENLKIDNFLYKYTLGKINHISISFPIFSILDIRKYYLDILIDILGGNMTSRLWVALREENQLVYSFNVFYECYEDGGFLNITFSCVDKNVKKTIKTIMDILEKIKKIKISKDEMDLTKKKAIMDIEINSEESCEIGEFYGEQVILGNEINKDIKNYNDIKKIYETCSEDILHNICNEFFIFPKMKLVLLGRIDKKEFNKITQKLIK